MQYLICPRCKFRVPANKHLCITCGHTMPTQSSARAVNDYSAPKVERPSFWQKILGLGVVAEDLPDKSKEEPALS